MSRQSYLTSEGDINQYWSANEAVVVEKRTSSGKLYEPV